jgi:hypothetical protein
MAGPLVSQTYQFRAVRHNCCSDRYAGIGRDCRSAPTGAVGNCHRGAASPSHCSGCTSSGGARTGVDAVACRASPSEGAGSAPRSSRHARDRWSTTWCNHSGGTYPATGPTALEASRQRSPDRPAQGLWLCSPSSSVLSVPSSPSLHNESAGSQAHHMSRITRPSAPE